MVANKLIQDFYDEHIKKEYPDITEKEAELICTAPFKMLKEVISSGTMKDVRFKFLGIFKIEERKVKYTRKNLQVLLEKGAITEEYLEKRIEILDRYEKRL